MEIAVKTDLNPAEQRFHPYPGNSMFVLRTVPPKCSKNYGICRKTDFKASEAMFLPESWQVYVQLTQNNHKSAQKRTANAVKPVSVPEETFFPVFWQQYVL